MGCSYYLQRQKVRLRCYLRFLFKNEETPRDKPEYSMPGEQETNALEGWMMYLSNLEGEELEAIAMDNPGIRKALTIEQAFWQSKKERRLYLHRQFAGGSPGRRRRRGKVTKKARKGTSSIYPQNLRPARCFFLTPSNCKKSEGAGQPGCSR